jgi:hypothetical protein
MTPVAQFLFKRLNGVPMRDIDQTWKRAVIDLVASDVPLDRHYRRLLAGELERLYFPPSSAQKRATKRQIEAAAFADMKAALMRSQGMTASAAEGYIAETYSLSVDALRKRRQRAPK